MTEKRVYFDIHFTAKNPVLSTGDILIRLHIDFEVQNQYSQSKLKYPLIKRGIYYAVRELSSQLNVVTSETNYDKLEKVYSIWICNEDVPEDLRNTITRYRIIREDIIGECLEPEEYHDLMEVVILRRGPEVLEDSVFEYLEGIFSGDVELVKKYVDVESNEHVKEALKTMCGLGDSLEQKGYEKGIKKERIRAIQKMIKKNYSKEEILDLDYTAEEYLKAEEMLCVKA